MLASLISASLSAFVHDVRYACRGLARRPGFALTILVTLALGIGANTAIFSLVRAVVLKPLPYREPDRLVHIYENHPKGARFKWGEDKGYIIVRPGTLYEWRRQSTSFERIDAWRWRTKTLTGGERAESVWANEVTDGFFTTAGVPPAIGRTLIADDFAPGVPRAVVVSDRLWRTRYGSDPTIVGRTIQIDGGAVPVVGVMPAGFYPGRYQTADLWVPYSSQPGENDDRVTWSFITLARLKPGVSFEQAHREMDTISDRLTAAYPQDYNDMSAVLVPVTGEVVGAYQTLFYTLLGAVALVLLVGCVNVANLMLARATERHQEFSIRTALGAPRRRMVQQVLTESLLLSGTGGLVGLLVARWTLPAALALLPPDSRVPRLNEATLDWPVLAFTLGVSLVAGILFGIVPAFRVSQAQLNESLKETSRGTSSSRRAKQFGDVLVAAEIAVSLLLLVGAGLLLRSFLRLYAVDSGFDTRHVLAMQLTVPTHRYGVYGVGGTNPGRARLYRDLTRDVSDVPGVQSAAVTALLPLKQGPNPWGISIEGRGAPADRERGAAATSLRENRYHHGSISIERVTRDYFRTMGVPLLRGRLIEARDVAAAPLVTVVNETFVKKFFASEDPLGRRITVDMTSYFPKMTIVGVVADNKMHGLDREPYALLYWSMDQFPSINAWLVVRARGDSRTLAQAVRSAVNRFDGDLAVGDASPMETVVADSIWRQRFTAWLIGAFAALALLLAAAGIYAVVAYSVSQRTHEMGLRITLGALPREILGLVVGHALRLAAIGVLIGVAASLALRRILVSQLFGVTPSDPLTIVAVSALLLLVAMAASAVPAIKALRVDPVAALRQT
jgi:putative ABC transport system permease protein